MADAATRARLEQAQARHSRLGKEVEREEPPSPEHQLAIADVAELSRSVAELEEKLADAERREDELVHQRAGRWNLVDLVLSTGLTALAALPGMMLVRSLAVWDVSSPLAVAAAVLLLPVPLVVNGLRYRRVQRRAERSRTVRSSRRLRATPER